VWERTADMITTRHCPQVIIASPSTVEEINSGLQRHTMRHSEWNRIPL
jgi:hypothetical protein